MSLRQKIAQLIVVHSYGEVSSQSSKEWRDLVHAVRDLQVGGVTVVNRVVSGSVRSVRPDTVAAFLNRLQRLSRVPLIAGADFERGASMRVSGTAKFPHLMAYGAADDPVLTRELGAYTAKEARALGFHWVFAPDADVNNNPGNPIINVRSFGEDPQLVSRHVAAFIEGAHSDPATQVLVTAKHFPGHGDTSVDSHIGLPVLNVDRPRMEKVELVPFRAAIAAGVDSIMSAHMAVPAIDSQGSPATVSGRLINGLLRDELGFDGIIITDAMDMGGLTKQYPPGEAAVRALEAGVDVLLMPPDPDAAINAILAAVRHKRLSEKQITESASRVLAAKVRVGLHRRKLVDLKQLDETIQSDAPAASAQKAADLAVTVVKNDGELLPLKAPSQACFWILTENRNSSLGKRMAEEIGKREQSALVMQADAKVSEDGIDELLVRGGQCNAHFVAAFVSAGAYRGDVALRGNHSYLMKSLLAARNPVAMTALGNPYLLRSFPDVTAYMATFSTAATAETAAVKVLFGEIPAQGRLPVSIPGYAKSGEGMRTGPTR